MGTFIPVTTLVAVVPASKQAEIHIVKHNWIMGYILVYLLLADSDIIRTKKKNLQKSRDKQ
jgi:hypothetical protein